MIVLNFKWCKKGKLRIFFSNLKKSSTLKSNSVFEFGLLKVLGQLKLVKVFIDMHCVIVCK